MQDLPNPRSRQPDISIDDLDGVSRESKTHIAILVAQILAREDAENTREIAQTHREIGFLIVQEAVRKHAEIADPVASATWAVGTLLNEYSEYTKIEVSKSLQQYLEAIQAAHNLYNLTIRQEMIQLAWSSVIVVVISMISLNLIPKQLRIPSFIIVATGLTGNVVLTTLRLRKWNQINQDLHYLQSVHSEQIGAKLLDER